MADFDSLPDDSSAGMASPIPSEVAANAPAPSSFDSMQDDGDKYSTTMQQVKAGLEGAAQGVLGPVAPQIEKESLGVDPAAIRGRAEANPGIHSGSEIAGFTGSMLTGVGEAALLGEVGKGAKIAAGLGDVGEAASLGQRAAAGAISQAAEMATLSAGDEVSKMIVQDPDASAETAMANIGLSAALGGIAGGVFSGAVSPLWKATMGPKLDAALKGIHTDAASDIVKATPDGTIRPIVRNGLSTMFGVPKEAIDDYLANHSAIQSAPDFSNVYEHAMDHVGKISDELEESKIAHGEAKEAFRDLQESMESDLKLKGADAAQAKVMSGYAFKDATTKLADDIQNKALDGGKQIAQAVETLRNNVIEQSSKAYDVLDQANAEIPLKQFFSKAEGLAQDLEAQGTLESKAQAARLRNYANDLSETFTPARETEGDKYARLSSGGAKPVQEALISGPQAKQMIQGLDKVSKYDFNATAFDKGLNSSYKQLRYNLDSILKETVPEYAKAMKPLAEATDLLSNLKKYGTEEEAVSSIKSLKNEAKFKNEWPILKDLEEKTGHVFTPDIEPYANSEMRANLVKSLPEYLEAEKAAADLNHLRHPATKMALESSIAESAQAKALEAAEARVAAAKAAKAEIKGIREDNIQGKLKVAGTAGKNLALEAKLSKIPGLEGKSLPEIMNLIRMKEAFEKNATRGSKHVNLYGTIIGAITGAIRHGAELGGIGMGAITGATVDNFGPQMVQKALDKYMQHFGNIGDLAKEGEKGAAKQLMGRILGANMAEPSGEGFKAGVDYISSTMRGETKLAKATEGVFKGGANALVMNRPTDADRAKLDKLVTQYQDQPNAQINAIQNSKVGHYLPNHGAALAKASSQAMQYLQTIKPRAHQLSPLDRPIQPTKAEVERYHRALDIAQNPLVVLQKAKDGTIGPDDIQDLHNMYPALYNRISTKISNSLISKVHSEEPIPYKTKMGVSLLLGQPLDSTMSPSSIMAAQPQPTPPVQAQMPKGSKTTSKLGKTNKSYMTPGQSAESDRSNRD